MQTETYGAYVDKPVMKMFLRTLMILVCGSNMTWEDIEEDEEELLSEVDSEAREDYYGHMSRAQIIFLVVLCATLLVFGAVLLILAGGV